MRLMAAVAVLLVLNGCASIAGDDGIDISDLDDTRAPVIEAVKAEGLAEYRSDQAGSVQWIACHRKDDKSKATFVVVNMDQSAFESAQSCMGWLAQAFLSASYDVIGVNRPGYGKTTGSKDFSGKASVAAIEAAMNAATKSEKSLKPVSGIWGYGSGAITAAFVTKKNQSLKYFVGGGGIYDLETYFSMANVTMKKGMQEAMDTQTPSAFYEERSVAWDVDGLPETVYLYHGKQDTVVPSKQSESLRDTLASSEFKVKLNLIEEIGHDMDPPKHRVIIMSVLSAIK